MSRDLFYVAGLLHDIGKFIERSKSYSVNDKFKHIKVGHPKYSAQLIDVLMQENPFFRQFSDKLIDLVLYHHEPRDDWQKIIQLADWLSSSEREEGNISEKYYNVPLLPVFSRLFDRDEQSFGYELAPLSISQGFPQNNPTITTSKYTTLVKGFLQELSSVRNVTQLLYLLEKYLWCVPAQTTNYVPDISLFDHAKTTAAIALCLYEQYDQGLLTTRGLKKMDKNDDHHFMLIKGDLSGIQDFIFNIPSKGAAKTLKAHSVYISLLTDVISRYLIREMNLREANVLYNGGGCFYILAPFTYEQKFLKLKSEVSHYLMNFHQGDIYLAMDYLPLAPCDFKEFSHHWAMIGQQINVLKNRKWIEIGLSENYGMIFGPFGIGSRDHQHCVLCGTEGSVREVFYNPETEKSICRFCESFRDLTNQLRDADCLIIKDVPFSGVSSVSRYQDLFTALGYDYKFAHKHSLVQEERRYAYLLNDTDFLQDGFAGYRFGMYSLPMRGEEQLTFEEISLMSTGDPKLAVLKMDVDNLGEIFSSGLGRQATISRVTFLSRMLSLFFEGYINYLIRVRDWHQHLYVVFSGGDDTFVIGSWNKVLDFVQDFRNSFREFTSNHPRVTLSAGISIVNYKYPVMISSQLAEKALDNAKSYMQKGELNPSKDKVSLFGEVFNWAELATIQSFKNKLLEIMRKHENYQKKEVLGRAFLYRIWKSTLGFKRILADSLKGKVDNVRFWRFAYYLRDIDRKDADDLLAEYRNIVLYNLLGKSTDNQIRNIMIIPAAVKCAQMETRKVRGMENER